MAQLPDNDAAEARTPERERARVPDEARELAARLAHCSQRAERLTEERDNLSRDRESLRAAYAATKREWRELEARHATLRRDTQRAAAAAAASRREATDTVRRWDAAIAQNRASVDDLDRLIGELAAVLRALLNSRRWRLGQALLAVPRTVLRRPTNSTAYFLQTLQTTVRLMEASRAHARASRTQGRELQRAPVRSDPTGDAARDVRLGRMLTDRAGALARVVADVAARRCSADRLIALAKEIHRSRSWKVGDLLLSLPSHAIRRPNPRTANDALSELLRKHEHEAAAQTRPSPNRGRSNTTPGDPRLAVRPQPSRDQQATQRAQTHRRLGLGLPVPVGTPDILAEGGHSLACEGSRGSKSTRTQHQRLAPPNPGLRKTRTTLLVEKRWRYLRYLHAREAVEMVKDDIESVLAIGVGKGLAELALALEYPDIQFHLTDIASATTPNWSLARRVVSEWKLPNVHFDVLDIRQRPSLSADLVCSTEVLEHIEHADQAAANMLSAAQKYVFALVPFADRKFNDNANRRRRALETHGHFVCGFDRHMLTRLFPVPIDLRGCYWIDKGIQFRILLESLDPASIRANADLLMERAADDITPGRVPTVRSEAAGIWILAKKATIIDGKRIVSGQEN